MLYPHNRFRTNLSDFLLCSSDWAVFFIFWLNICKDFKCIGCAKKYDHKKKLLTFILYTSILIEIEFLYRKIFFSSFFNVKFVRKTYQEKKWPKFNFCLQIFFFISLHTASQNKIVQIYNSTFFFISAKNV